MNYLEEVESEFSRIRGRWTPLAPLDWALAQDWENKQIPLSVVFRAMDDVHKKFIAANPTRTDRINALRYFEKGVDKQFAEWQTSQVGKSDYIQDDSCDVSAFAVSSSLDYDDIRTLHFLESRLKNGSQPEPLRSATKKAVQDIVKLIVEATTKPLSSNEIETRLEAISSELDLSLVVSLPEVVRVHLLDTIKRDYGKITITAESRQKLLIKLAYQHFALPKLTLFEL